MEPLSRYVAFPCWHSPSGADTVIPRLCRALRENSSHVRVPVLSSHVHQVLVKEDGFEVASDDESTAPVVFDAIKQLLGRSLGSAGVTHALQSSCGAVGQGVPAVPSTGTGAAVGLGLGALPGAATGGVVGGSSTGGGDTVGAASGRPARSQGLRGGSDSVPPS